MCLIFKEYVLDLCYNFHTAFALIGELWSLFPTSVHFLAFNCNSYLFYYESCERVSVFANQWNVSNSVCGTK